MHLLVSFAIPFVISIVLLLFFRSKTKWWEYLILFIPSILIGILINFIMISSNTHSKEYLGYYVTHVQHYERWNEWISKTCTRSYTDSDGNTHTESYDCSYVENHPEYWIIVDNGNNQFNISKHMFKYIVSQWGTQSQFIDMKRRYHTIDGDAYRYDWNSKIENVYTTTIVGSYVNKIQATNSIFNFEKITKNEAKQYGLYLDYPNLESVVTKGADGWFGGDSEYQPTLIGFKNQPDSVKYWDFVNGFNGKRHQFRGYLIAYYNQPYDISLKQRSYWIGGNKNEFIICVGLDSLSNKIEWVNTISWTDDVSLAHMVENYLLQRGTLYLGELSNNLMEWIPLYWKRKSFKDFDYLKPTITQKQLLWLSIILALINIGIAVWVVRNDFTNEPQRYYW
jgi:hypothetical protein